MSVATETRRDVSIDRLRGVAILLMVLDHTLLVATHTWNVGAPWEAWFILLRLSVTRLALPMFMLLSGWLLARKPLEPRRWLQVLAFALASTLVVSVTGLPIAVPDILVVWCVVMVGAELIRKFPVWAVGLGVVQLITWPLPWDGYQPGAVLALVAAGVLAKNSNARAFTVGRRAPRFLEPVGRHPLGWYLGHLCLLGAITVVIEGGFS